MKTWQGTVPSKCQICGDPIDQEFIDGATQMGPWAIMCPTCHKPYSPTGVGVGLGVGKGQRYERQEVEGGFGGEHRWVKVEG